MVASDHFGRPGQVGSDEIRAVSLEGRVLRLMEPSRSHVDPLTTTFRAALFVGAIGSALAGIAGRPSIAGGFAAGTLISVISVWATAALVRGLADRPEAKRIGPARAGHGLALGKFVGLALALWASLHVLGFAAEALAAGVAVLPAVLGAGALIECRAACRP